MPGRKVDKIGQYSQEQAGNWAFDANLAGKVHLAAISSGVEMYVLLEHDVSSAVTILSNTVAASATQTIISAATDTAIRIHGMSIGNGGANLRNVELRFGSTCFFRAPFAADGGLFNWNKIGGTPLSSANQSVIVWMDDAGTVTATVDYSTVSTV